MFFLDRTVVVYEDECFLILGVSIALRALVSGAEIASGVVGWQGSFRGALLLSSGRSI